MARNRAPKSRCLGLIVTRESRATSPHTSMRTGTQRETKRHAAASAPDQREPISVHTTLSPTSMCGICSRLRLLRLPSPSASAATGGDTTRPHRNSSARGATPPGTAA